MKFPALAIAFSLAAGILAGEFLAPRAAHALIICLFTAPLLLLAGFLLLLRRRNSFAGVAALLAWSLLGAAAVQIAPLAVPADHIIRQIAAQQIDLKLPLRWRGRLRSDPLRLPWGLRYELDLDEVQAAGIWRPVSGGMRIGYFFNERDERDAQQAPSAPGDAGDATGPDAATNGVTSADSAAADGGAGDRPARPIPHVVFRAGDRVEALLRAGPARNFGDPGAFDYKTFLARQQIDVTGFLRSAALLTRLSAPPPTFAQRLARVRGRLLDAADSVFPGDKSGTGRAAVARAMLLGDRSFLDSEQVETFQDTGVYHVLVLAGLHVGILAALLLWTGRTFRLPIALTTLVTMGVLSFYVAIVQDRPPIIRAALMATIYLLARLMFRRTALLNSVGVAALAILIVRPSELGDPSFQLSFVAALAIAGLAAPFLRHTAEHYRRALDHLGDVTRDAAASPPAAQFRLDLRAAASYLASHLPRGLSRFSEPAVTAPCRAILALWELTVISIAIQLGMLPLMAQYFHRISPLSVVANIPAVLLTALIVPFGFLALGGGFLWSGLGHLLGKILSAAIGILVSSVNWFATLPGVFYRVPSPPLVLIIAFFAAGILFSASLLSLRRRLPWVTFAAWLIFAVLIAAHPFAPRLVRGRLEVTVLDVGQGDSIFVAFPDGKTMLVDGGGLPGGAYLHGHRPGIDIGEDVVSPYLWSRGLKRIDIVALTHGHEDHLGGLPAVLRNFRVGQLWVGRDVDSAPYRGLISQAGKRGVPVIHRVEGEHFDWSAVRVSVLWPDNDDPVRAATNDDSLVMRLEDGHRVLLLTGDIERPVERGLLAQQANGKPENAGELAADFLKVPHHGSKTSTTQPFFDAVRPQFAAISVGESNTFGHPSPEVIDRISTEGARIFRTDRNGAITALTDGTSLEVHSFLTPSSTEGSGSPLSAAHTGNDR